VRRWAIASGVQAPQGARSAELWALWRNPVRIERKQGNDERYQKAYASCMRSRATIERQSPFSADTFFGDWGTEGTAPASLSLFVRSCRKIRADSRNS